jgi:AhpD family alkylhydroperoxidase
MTLPRIEYAKVSPGAVKGMYSANAYFDDCTIPQALRRLIELRVSQINGCTYCIWLHSRQARGLGEPDLRIAALAHWRSASCFSDIERAALNWAELVTQISLGVPSDDTFAALRHCFDERQIVDLTAIIANMNALNRMAISFRLEAPGSDK